MRSANVVGRGGLGLLMMGRCRKFSLRFFVVMCRTRPICHFIFSVQRLKCISDPLANTNNIGRCTHKNLSAMHKQQHQQRPRQNNEPAVTCRPHCVHLSETEQSHHNLMSTCARAPLLRACARSFAGHASTTTR